MTSPPPNSELRYEIVTDGASETTPESPVRVLLRALRGRYRLTVSLAVTLAVLGTIVGFHLKPAKYVSRGLVRIEAERSPILYSSHENRTPPMFDALVSAQEQMLKSRVILDAALARPEMRDAGWPEAPEGVAELQRSLMVKRGRRENLIMVSVTHPDPTMAQTAVNAILTEFEKSPGAADGLSRAEKEETLMTREDALERDLRQLRAQVLERSGQYGADGIERMHATRLDELISIDRKIAALRSPSGRAAGDLGGAVVAELRQRELELLATRAALKDKFLPRHPIMRDIERRLTAINVQRRLQAGLDDESGAPVADAARELEALRATRAEILAELDDLGAQRVAIAALTDRAGAVVEQLHATRRRLDELRLEARAGKPNRISIAAWGERPLAPTYDHRAKLALAGALGGASFGIGLVFLLGLLDRRARFADELARVRDDVDLIGVLPDVDELDADGARHATVAINQVRNLLDLGVETHPVIAITSCARGEGRTSLAYALAASFAAAGRWTLILDGDVNRPSMSQVGGHLRLSIESLAPEDGGEISRSTVLDALASARRRFDVIIIDCGPVTESPEACLIAGVADRAVLMVNRHRRSGEVRNALAQLERFGAQIAGLLLNRAGVEDLASHAVTDQDPDPDAPAPFMPAFSSPSDGPAAYAFPAVPPRRRAA
jgi:uncharacterized protein involved in exopolysaccharide biosynthesis